MSKNAFITHQGGERTLDKIPNVRYWPHLKTDIV